MPSHRISWRLQGVGHAIRPIAGLPRRLSRRSSTEYHLSIIHSWSVNWVALVTRAFGGFRLFGNVISSAVLGLAYQSRRASVGLSTAGSSRTHSSWGSRNHGLSPRGFHTGWRSRAVLSVAGTYYPGIHGLHLPQVAQFAMPRRQVPIYSWCAMCYLHRHCRRSVGLLSSHRSYIRLEILEFKDRETSGT